MGGGVKWEIVIGGLTGLGVVVGLIKALVNAVDSRTDEKIKLALTNGVGDFLEQRIEAGLARALRDHVTICPQAPRVESLEDRIITLERNA